MTEKIKNLLIWVLIGTVSFLLSGIEISMTVRWMMLLSVITVGIFHGYHSIIRKDMKNDERENPKTRNIIALVFICISFTIGIIYLLKLN